MTPAELKSFLAKRTAPWPGDAGTEWRVAHNGIVHHVSRPDFTALCSRKISLYAKRADHGGTTNYGNRICRRCALLLK